jgi:hypothetical protein
MAEQFQIREGHERDADRQCHHSELQLWPFCK